MLSRSLSLRMLLLLVPSARVASASSAARPAGVARLVHFLLSSPLASAWLTMQPSVSLRVEQRARRVMVRRQQRRRPGWPLG